MAVKNLKFSISGTHDVIKLSKIKVGRYVRMEGKQLYLISQKANVWGSDYYLRFQVDEDRDKISSKGEWFHIEHCEFRNVPSDADYIPLLYESAAAQEADSKCSKRKLFR